MDPEKPPASSTTAPTANDSRLSFQQLIGYVVALACLAWVFHDVHGGQIVRQVAGLQWGWIILAVISDLLCYVSQGLRWRLLLKPLGEVSVLKAIQAVYVGLFINEVLPLRPGELARGYLISRWLTVDFVAVLPSMVVERLMDGVWLAIGVGLTAIFVQLPRNLMDAADVLGILILLATALFIYLIFRPERPAEWRGGPGGGRPSGWLITFLRRIARGIKQIGVTRNLYVSFVISALPIIFQILGFWLVMRAYGLELSLWVGAAVMLIVILGTVIPNAPSNVGAYQFFTVVGLSLFGVDKTTATGFSVVVFVLLSAPFWLIGTVAISQTGLTLREIRSEVAKLMRGRASSGDNVL